MKKIISILFLIVGLFLVAIPTIYWFQHPELSKMEISRKFILVYAAAFSAVVMAKIIIKSDK